MKRKNWLRSGYESQHTVENKAMLLSKALSAIITNVGQSDFPYKMIFEQKESYPYAHTRAP